MKTVSLITATVSVFLFACAQKPKLAAKPESAPMPKTALAANPVMTDRSADLENARLKIQSLIAEAFRPVYFPFDKYDLSQKSRDLLSQAGDLMKREPSIKVTIEGNTDERGTEDYNLALGQRRAAVVKEYLASYGIGIPRLNLISYGAEKPVQHGHDEQSWALNRRDEFKVTF